MLTKLTKDQEQLLAELNKETVDNFYNFGKVDEERVVKSVHTMYAYMKLKQPAVEFLDFSKPHLGSKYISAVGSAVGSAVRSAVRSAVGSAVDSAVGSAVDSAVHSAVRSAVRSAVGSAVNSAVGSAVDSAVHSAVRSAVGSAVGSADYFSLSYYRWFREDWFCTYYKFFSKILPDFPVDLFEEYQKANDAGFLYYFMFEKVCFVVKMPEKIDQWVGQGYNRRLHSDTKEALDISGLKLYFLNGVQFPKDLWEKVVSRTMPFQDILAIQDIDQRTQAMKYGNVREFLKHQDAKCLDTHTKLDIQGNEVRYELWQIPQGDIFAKNVHYAIYNCPSTGREYMKGVPECKTIAEAMAWGMSDEQSVISPENWKLLVPLLDES